MLLDPEILEAASPVRRQLLGGMGDLSHPLGDGASENDPPQKKDRFLPAPWLPAKKTRSDSQVHVCVRADLSARLSVAACTAIGVGTSQHWFPSSEDKVPLKAWAEARARPGEPMDWCAAATGLPYRSRRL